MKRQTLTNLIVLPALLMILSAQAHDPEEHSKEGQAPDCAYMKDMDHSKMDKDDPVMQAMMQKCTKAMDHDGAESQGEHTEHDEQGEKAETKESAKHSYDK